MPKTRAVEKLPWFCMDVIANPQVHFSVYVHYRGGMMREDAQER